VIETFNYWKLISPLGSDHVVSEQVVDRIAGVEAKDDKVTKSFMVQ
jgi:hypothetical protein